MSNFLVPLLLVISVLMAWFARQVHLFGGTKATFRRELSLTRKELQAARSEVRTLSKQLGKQTKMLGKEHGKAQGNYEQAVKIAELELLSYTQPGKGPRVSGLGRVGLYQHALLVDHSQVVPLLGLKVGVQSMGATTDLLLTLSNGKRQSLPFSTIWKTSGEKQVRDYAPEQVKYFSDEIHNAIIGEHEWLEQRPHRIPKAQRDLALAQGNTSAVDAAKGRLDWAESSSPLHVPLQKARERAQQLEAAWTSR